MPPSDQRRPLTADDFAAVEDVFARISGSQPDERPGQLDASLADRPDLRDELVALLDAHDRIVAGGAHEADGRAGVDVGDAVGAYRLVERIGRGGMGEVFKAHRNDGAFDQLVAVKVMPSTSVASQALRRFRSERQILATLQHPHIVTLLDGGVTADGFAYLVMEYVEGASLTAYCQQHAVPLIERLRLFCQVCSAAQYAHRHGVVHRDLKPANIVVSAAGVAKVLDFGVAKLLDTTPGTAAGLTLTQAGLPGPLTPNYASPEQLRGLPITTSCDVYALGVVLYELLTGVRPYETADRPFDAVLRLVLDVEPPRPSAAAGSSAAGLPYDARRTLAGDLDAIVLRALAKDAEDRYGSPEELAADVERHLAGVPVSAREPSLGYLVRKLAARHKAVFLSTGISGLLIVAALVAALWQARMARNERDRARVEAAKSAQVAGFMREIFRSGSPSPRPVTAEELLARGRDRIAQLDAQPDVQSMLLLELGIAHRHLGLYDAGLDLLARSAALREQHQGPDAPETAHSLAEWGRQLRMAARYDEAQSVLERALAIRERQLGPDHPDVAHSLDALAGVHWNRGRFEQAVAMVARAVSIMEHSRPDDQDVDRMRGNLGAALVTLGEVGRARAVYQAMLTHAERIGGHDGYNVGFAVLGVGATLLEDEQWQAARPFLERALRFMEQYYGQRHSTTAGVQARLGRALTALGDRTEARRLLVAAVRTREQTLGVDHPELAEVLVPYATLLTAEGDLEAAGDVLRRAERIRATGIGAQSPHLAEVLVELSQVEIARGRAPVAQSHLERALAIQRTTLVARHRRLVPTLTGLGEALMAQGRAADARVYCAEAAEISRAKLPPQHSQRLRAEAALARSGSPVAAIAQQ